ncbi:MULTISPECIES: DUF1330 domain-containing protein [Serratia]|nr:MULTISPECIES: DUF1330 domain-containing protein [Serratia]MDW5510616.1 DUF1330 domain-containing protein [Serratia proteamaculans]
MQYMQLGKSALMAFRNKAGGYIVKKMILACLVVFSGISSALAVTPAYYVAEFQSTDREAIKPYSAQVESTFSPYGGRFIVRGGEPDIKEGFGAQGRLVIIKFDSLKRAQDWYNSPEYQNLIPIRHRSGNSRTYIVEGLPEHE